MIIASVLYLLIGVIVSLFMVYNDWKNGYDITLDYLLLFLLSTATWPVMIIYLVLISETVLIKGKKK